MGFFSNLLGIGPKVDYAALIIDGATIVDVRTPQEFKGGHPNGAVNIPLDRLLQNLKKIKKMHGPIICVCKSGMRSGNAVRVLKSNGIEAYNAGAWTNLT
ncbi:MAG: sulfurtransferase [Crocinitomicaceae bacterium]|nr:sulfurtransferase [Crocinitomicaceae bacterium]|tara:strand:- start:22244 stop:22543 length:300 start_codon:yes stop_codon:yes gene_type:complete